MREVSEVCCNRARDVCDSIVISRKITDLLVLTISDTKLSLSGKL
jgi:hypothetical protein